MQSWVKINRGDFWLCSSALSLIWFVEVAPGVDLARLKQR